MPDVVETCPHVTQVKIVANRDDKRGCGDCLKIGSSWVHLRPCLTCGTVGCCDSSEHRHARNHFERHHHGIVQSMEPGEMWAYYYADEAFFRSQRLNHRSEVQGRLSLTSGIWSTMTIGREFATLLGSTSRAIY